MVHPNDDTGDVLRRLEAKGDDLTTPRNIDFTVVFSSEDAAKQFAEHFRSEGYRVTVEKTETESGFPWDVVVVRYMVPLHKDIGDFEASLAAIATPLGGHNDGWGCITQNKFAKLT